MKSDRELALDAALYSSRLLDEKYFSRVDEAIKNKNKTEFDAVCKEAGLPEDLWHRLYEAFTMAPEYRVW